MEGSMFKEGGIAPSKQARMVQTYIERRTRLWAQVRADNPSYTETEIEARLEQFGV
jgi:hypothetical protein